MLLWLFGGCLTGMSEVFIKIKECFVSVNLNFFEKTLAFDVTTYIKDRREGICEMSKDEDVSS